MADPGIWNRFPLDLLPLVIEQAAPLDLFDWYLVTEHAEPKFLHRVVLGEMYRICEVNQELLLCNWGARQDPNNPVVLDDDETMDGSESDWVDESDSESESDTWSLRENVGREKRYREKSRYIKQLILDFKFQENRSADAMVAFEDVEFALEALFSQSSIEEIEHDGILYPQWFDRITKIPTLKVLKVRKTLALCPCTRRSIIIPLSGIHLHLEWRKLRQMDSLRVLHVSRLVAAEAAELAHAVWSLGNLEELYVGVPRGSGTAEALTIFLKSFFLINETETGSQSQSPMSSLKSLSLVDCQDLEILPCEPQTEFTPNLRSLPKLQTLYLDVARNILLASWLLGQSIPPPVKHLAVSMRRRTPSTFYWSNVEELLTKYCATLQTVTFLNIWGNSVAHSFDSASSTVRSMHLWQAYLTRPYPFPSKIDYHALKWRIFSSGSHRQRWGSEMRHLRVDQIQIDQLRIDRIDRDPDDLQQLRVLVLRPMAKQAYDPVYGHGYRAYPYPCEPFGPDLPADLNSLRESEIAQAIAAQDLPSLRIIMVGRYKYWVQGKQHDQRLRKVWFLRRALEDPIQEAEILRLIDRDDWDFLADAWRSDALAEYPTEEALHQANRVVFRNENMTQTP